MTTSRIKQKVLVFSGAVLVLMTVVILVVLLDGAEDPAPSADGPGAQQPAAPASTAPRVAPASGLPQPGASKRPPPTASEPRVTRTPDAGAKSSTAATPPRPDPHVIHSAAPAAEPATITAEKDPTKRQELRRMHRLATSEVRVRLLGRRSRMLRESLARARKDGSWSADKISREEASLQQIEATVAATKTEVVRLKKQLSIRR